MTPENEKIIKLPMEKSVMFFCKTRDDFRKPGKCHVEIKQYVKAPPATTKPRPKPPGGGRKIA